MYQYHPMYYYQPVYDFDYLYRQQNAINQIANHFHESHPDVVSELKNAGMNEQLISYLISVVIQYTIHYANQSSGSLYERTKQLYQALQTHLPWIPNLLRAYHLSEQQMSRILRMIIRFTLQQISGGSAHSHLPQKAEG